jgi:hypothetical protein
VPSPVWAHSEQNAKAAPTEKEKKFAATRRYIILFTVSHKKEYRPYPQTNNTTKTLFGGPASGVYPFSVRG